MYHEVAEEGVPFSDIAAVIGRRLDLPVIDRSGKDASKQFGWLSMFAGVDAPATSVRTRAELGWEPTQPGLLADIDRSGLFQSLSGIGTERIVKSAMEIIATRIGAFTRLSDCRPGFSYSRRQQAQKAFFGAGRTNRPHELVHARCW